MLSEPGRLLPLLHHELGRRHAPCGPGGDSGRPGGGGGRRGADHGHPGSGLHGEGIRGAAAQVPGKGQPSRRSPLLAHVDGVAGRGTRGTAFPAFAAFGQGLTAFRTIGFGHFLRLPPTAMPLPWVAPSKPRGCACSAPLDRQTSSGASMDVLSLPAHQKRRGRAHSHPQSKAMEAVEAPFPSQTDFSAIPGERITDGPCREPSPWQAPSPCRGRWSRRRRAAARSRWRSPPPRPPRPVQRKRRSR